MGGSPGVSQDPQGPLPVCVGNPKSRVPSLHMQSISHGPKLIGSYGVLRWPIKAVAAANMRAPEGYSGPTRGQAAP